MGRKAGLCLALLLGIASAARAQVVDQKQVDAAIEKGVAWLKNAPSPGSHHEIANCDELILLTLVTAGVTEEDPKVQELLKRVLEAPLNRTYPVVLQAMALEEIDRVKYQSKIAQCGLFLVDNQCKNGQWDYGQPTPGNVPVEAGPANVATGGTQGLAGSGPGGGLREFMVPGEGENKFLMRKKPTPTRKITIRATRGGPAAGDNSNSQYAALGMRACHDSGVMIPKEVIAHARQWWISCAFKPEKLDKNELARQDVKTGPGGGEVLPTLPPVGWCYRGYGLCDVWSTKPGGDSPDGGMTAGAVGAICIYDYMLGVKWKSDVYALGGISWMAQHFSVTENPGPSENAFSHPNSWLLYYLYAMERVGMLYDTRLIGKHDWYMEGATYLLGAQNGDGSWFKSAPDEGERRGSTPTYDTCYAILFLKRATRKFVDVATGGTPVPNK